MIPSFLAYRPYFNSRPHQEVDAVNQPCHFLTVLSTHDLTRRSTRFLSSLHPADHAFNSRPHKEVDHCVSTVLFHHFAFQLTTSQGGRRKKNITLNCEEYFQLTTSQGGRQNTVAVVPESKKLSTHDLTRRSTLPDRNNLSQGRLSTHDLTTRTTCHILSGIQTRVL